MTNIIIDPDTATTAHALHERVVALKGEISERWLLLGALLGLMRRQRLYEALGHDTFEEYLASPDVAIGRTSAFRFVALAEAVGHVPTLGPLAPPVPLLSAAEVGAMGASRAEIILPVVKDAAPEERAAWVADAQVLSVRDLRRKVQEARGAEWSERRAYLEWLAGRIRGQAATLPYERDPAGSLDDIAALAQEAATKLRSEGTDG